METLVTGASGFVGSLLVPALLGGGNDVRALGRDTDRVKAALEREGVETNGHRGGEAGHRGEMAGDGHRVTGSGRGPGRLEIVGGDVLTGEGLEEGLAGVSVAYYLIHSMERAGRGSGPGGTFAERERLGAENFARAAGRAGVERIVYLGGLVGDSPGGPSRHLASRAAVEEILRGEVSETVALRASIVIGVRSRSFRFLVRLVERMPVLALPAWRRFRTRPIDARDVTAMLVAAARAPVGGRTLDIGGPDILTYEEMIMGIAEQMLVHRPRVGVGVNLTAVTARVAAAIGDEDPELVVPLMEGLGGDLLPRDDHAQELLSVDLHSYESAVAHALGEWEQREPLAAR